MKYCLCVVNGLSDWSSILSLIEAVSDTMNHLTNYANIDHIERKLHLPTTEAWENGNRLYVQYSIGHDAHAQLNVHQIMYALYITLLILTWFQGICIEKLKQIKEFGKGIFNSLMVISKDCCAIGRIMSKDYMQVSKLWPFVMWIRTR